MPVQGFNPTLDYATFLSNDYFGPVQNFEARKSKLETVWRKCDQLPKTNDLQVIDHMFDENWMPSLDLEETGVLPNFERKESKLQTVWKKSISSPSNIKKPKCTKLFVGKIPISMEEWELRQMFEEYGQVRWIHIIQDKLSGEPKGCCFVKYNTEEAALRARDALHNVRTLKGMRRPMQVIPESSEKRTERQIFVGCINRQWNDDDVRKLFEIYGTVEECRVVRDRYRRSKGYAFVIFSSKQSAASALADTSRSNLIMQGCYLPLTVKNADSQHERDQRRLQRIEATFWSLTVESNSTTSIQLAKAAAFAAGQDLEGPEGCNLFIYFLPDEVTDASLALLFVPFGNVTSAKVVMDIKTNKSKGFGFITFDNEESARLAINHMNGYQMGSRRLSVQLKKPKYAMEPY